jgi:hypothetical protein
VAGNPQLRLHCILASDDTGRGPIRKYWCTGGRLFSFQGQADYASYHGIELKPLILMPFEGFTAEGRTHQLEQLLALHADVIGGNLNPTAPGSGVQPPHLVVVGDVEPQRVRTLALSNKLSNPIASSTRDELDVLSTSWKSILSSESGDTVSISIGASFHPLRESGRRHSLAVRGIGWLLHVPPLLEVTVEDDRTDRWSLEQRIELDVNARTIPFDACTNVVQDLSKRIRAIRTRSLTNRDVDAALEAARLDWLLGLDSPTAIADALADGVDDPWRFGDAIGREEFARMMSESLAATSGHLEITGAGNQTEALSDLITEAIGAGRP